MLEYIEFKSDKFTNNEEYNCMSELTRNTIILCNNYKIMDFLSKEIINTVDKESEYNNYWCEDEDDYNAKLSLCFGLQRIIELKEQKITLALEPSIIYKAIIPEDIWFCDIKDNKIIIYPMLAFKGSYEIWENGKDEVYKTICKGQYGCYDGKFFNLLNE